ncbi:MAG: hypothetical protein ACK5V3_01320 [Bdellovibrionales bacterium]
MISCPRCGLQVLDLHPIEANLGQKLAELGELTSGSVCLSCLTELRKTASGGKGGLLLAEE